MKSNEFLYFINLHNCLGLGNNNKKSIHNTAKRKENYIIYVLKKWCHFKIQFIPVIAKFSAAKIALTVPKLHVRKEKEIHTFYLVKMY